MAHSTIITMLSLGVLLYLLVPIQCDMRPLDIDENTGCPSNVSHACAKCAHDQNRWGCYCELDSNDELITGSIYTPCPTDIDDPCRNHSCQNGASCVRQGLLSYRCNCTTGFGNVMCNESLPKCSDRDVTCTNGECFETTDPLIPLYCQCYDGTRRDPRQNDTCPLSPCYKNDADTPICQNNGTCQLVNNMPICECAPGWAGQNCTKQLKTPLCKDRVGVCGEGHCQQSLSAPYYSCSCGSYPSTFAKSIDELIKCEDSSCYTINPCQNGATCSNTGKGAFICQCPPRFTGSKCERASACFNGPCVNGGTCQAFNETIFYCTCPAYFTGQRCEIRIPDPCTTKDCGPYGQCRDVHGLGVCFCHDGFHHDESPCQDACHDKNCGPGVCTHKINATYEAICSCPLDRKGISCELANDVCRDGPRCGGGFCKPSHASARGYSCICENGVVQADPCGFPKSCPLKDCGEQGLCVETDGVFSRPGTKPIYYVCLCKHGYITSHNCDALLQTTVPAAAKRCGPNGRTYPSRNPYNPIGCWCNNGTHIEEIDEHGPSEYCV